jgi:hypothetical protein
MDEKLVEIAQYDSAELAHVDHDILGDAGIAAYIENENLSMAGLYYTMPTCGVKLLVSQSDEEKARQILKEIDDSGPIEEEADRSESDEEKHEI